MNDTVDVYRRQNLGNRIGFGARGALVVVDFVNGFNDANVLGGGNIASAIDHTAELLQVARTSKMPIAFTRIVYEPDGANIGGFVAKLPSLRNLTEGNPLSQVVPELTPEPGEHIIRKTHASAFFGTDLCSWLHWRGVDTVLVTGCTTSGCVRATVVDAASYNFKPIVVRDCVGDRAIAPHEANLFDMDQKYADVVSKEAALAWTEGGGHGADARSRWSGAIA